MKTQAIVLADVDVTPKNVRMGNQPGPVEVIDPTWRRVYLVGGIVEGGSGPPPSGTYPSEGHVRAPDKYGPTGVEYTGNETLPLESQVGVGVGYGAGGTEFTGSMAGGSSKRRIRGIW